MNHCVPEFNIGDEDHSPSASALPGQNSVQDDVIMELLWRNGQVVVQSQNPRLVNQSSPPPTSNSSAQVSMHEEEMISWLQYPLEGEAPPFGRGLNDLLYHPPTPPSSTAPAELRPIPPRPQVLHNFPHFSRIPTGRLGESRNAELRESTVVDSCDTPAVDRESEINLPTMNTVEVYSGGNRGCDSFSGASTLGDGCMSISMSRDGDTYDLMLTSSPDGSAATATTEYQSEDVEIESYDEKKQPSRGNSKRLRAAEVHNLSERRRRDKINKKMRVLQDLIPRSGKTDKASMLDEAIEYLKSLQAQVQMMAMGYGMVPMMFPGAQQYMPTMGMGMSRPMMPYPSQMNPRFPPHAFPVPLVSNQADASLNPIGMPGYNVARAPNPPQPYHQYVGVHHIPMQIPETKPASQPGTEQESTSSDDQDEEKHQCG